MEGFMKSYSIKKVSEMIEVPEGTLRQWETDFKGLLVIPRDEKGSRYYTDLEIETLHHIKAMREKKISKEMIKDLLTKKKGLEPEEKPNFPQPSLPQLKQSEVVEALRNIQNLPQQMEATFALALDKMREEIKAEVRNEIRNEVKNEVIEEVRKELSKSSEHQQKLLEGGNDRTSEQIETLSELIKEMKELQKSTAEENVPSKDAEEKVIPEKKGFFKKWLGS